MKQFILSAPPDSGGIVRITGKDHHYLVRVRRLMPGAVFEARLPGGEPVRVLIRSVGDGCLTGECLADGVVGSGLAGVPMAGSDPDGLPPILLFQALPKGTKMDLIIRQAVESGITEIVPFVSAHSVPRLTDGGRLERWRRIVKEARQQSGSPIATEVRAPCDVAGLVAYWGELKSRYQRAVGIILHPPRDAEIGEAPLEQGTFHGYLNTEPDLVAAAIGPEGGFSPGEVSEFTAAGFKALTMGTTVLRTETAALYTGASIRIILLERASWIRRPQQR
jgi:16S rRNA (uracil1498-N3)-methyltransferase